MWLAVSVQADSTHAERLSDALLECGAISVSIEDADAGTEREQAQFGEPGEPAAPLWAASRVLALFEPGTDIAQAVAAAAAAAGLDPATLYQVSEVAEQNWVQLTQSQFEPIRVGERLWIVPSWHHPPDPGAINIVLDPGMAFGTGSHPTTHLCLEWLYQRVRPGDTVLDYGCGSGILAIAAARLGASRVVGVDIDERALVTARDNARNNSADIEFVHSSAPLQNRFDRVVANILTNPLCVLAPLLAARVAPGGALALSGVLESQVDQVRQAYRPYLELRVGAVREGWVRLEAGA